MVRLDQARDTVAVIWNTQWWKRMLFGLFSSQVLSVLPKSRASFAQAMGLVRQNLSVGKLQANTGVAKTEITPLIMIPRHELQT
jgi:hypothetical protein